MIKFAEGVYFHPEGLTALCVARLKQATDGVADNNTKSKIIGGT
jgi:hypothetical protein